MLLIRVSLISICIICPESEDLTDKYSKRAEEYLVRVWTGARCSTVCKTFDHTQYESHINSNLPKPLELLAATSSINAPSRQIILRPKQNIESELRRTTFYMLLIIKVLFVRERVKPSDKEQKPVNQLSCYKRS